MKTEDSNPKRAGEHQDTHRLNAHPEPQLIEGHPTPECLPPHNEEAPKAAAAGMAGASATAKPMAEAAPTSDAQEASGIFGNAARVALGILAALVVCAILFWRPGVSDNRPMTASNADITTGAAVMPSYTAVAIPTTDPQTPVAHRAMTAANGTVQPGTVVVYLFNTDSSGIPETEALTAIANVANQTGKTVVIKAYTDETGRAAYNQRLSERRAKAVSDYMANHGVPASKISAKGYGPTHAYASNALDRRAEVSLR